MARKRDTAEEIIGQLRAIEIELGEGLAVVDAIRQVGITDQRCAISFSTGICSTRCGRRGSSWKVGANATIRPARIARWGIGHPPQRPGPSHRSVYRRERTEPVA